MTAQTTASPLNNKKVAMLLATGFEEKEFLILQKHLREAGSFIKLVSSDLGLVTSWGGDLWGHNYAVDVPLNQALAADFSLCAIPGGMRSIDKLVLSAHTRRFVNGFLQSGKPVITLNEATGLIQRLDIDPDTSAADIAPVNDNVSEGIEIRGDVINVSGNGAYDMNLRVKSALNAGMGRLRHKMAA